MNPSTLNQIVEAVLYEGYILYPYRSTSKKNRERFTFGRVYPACYSASQNGAEPCVTQTECLLQVQSPDATLKVNVRFLHPMMREVGTRSPSAGPDENVAANFTAQPQLEVNGNIYHTWQESMERDLQLTVPLRNGLDDEVSFSFQASCVIEPILDRGQNECAAMRRRQEYVDGVIMVSAKEVAPTVLKICVRVLNCTPVADVDLNDQNAVLMCTFASTHTILQAQGGHFISQTAPPADCVEAAAACKNIGTWPVLVGDEKAGACDTMLSSPIILPDFPQIASESPGTLFDGTEIDEILTLRILTLTDEEKREMRCVDEQARRLLERTESLSEDHLWQMHGTMRNETPFEEAIFGRVKPLEEISVGASSLKKGDVVRIRPKTRADIMDLALAGKAALIEAIEEDAEGRVHLALVLQDDPGKDLGMMRQPGHRFFFGVDEIEPIRTDA